MVKGAEKTAPAAALPPGTRLGKYELVQRLALGGMAEIYLARSEGIRGFEKYVVLKRILPQFAGDEHFMQMFLDEARLAATLQHANVVQVYDFGEAEGSYFIIMEYVHGEDLRRILRKSAERGRGFSLENALAVVTGAAAGLHHAHEQANDAGEPLNLVHRDVSPANILIGFDGVVKVTDFGIAKARTGHQTTTGSLKGKLSYMSPEQCRAEPLDRRSDVFALGVILHELTCGRRLYAADNDYALIHKIVDEDAPRPSSISPGYPPELEQIVIRSLRRPKDERYGSAAELQADLEFFASQFGLAITPAGLAATLRDLFGKRELPWRFRSSSRPHDLAEAAGSESKTPTPVAVPVRVTTIERPPRRRRVWPFAVLGTVIVAVVLGIVWTSKEKAAPPAPATAPAAAPAARSPDASRVPPGFAGHPGAAPDVQSPDASRVPPGFAGHPGAVPAPAPVKTKPPVAKPRPKPKPKPKPTPAPPPKPPNGERDENSPFLPK